MDLFTPEKIKFRYEVDMCKHVTEVISGILIPTKHRFFAEVPRNANNDHADMLFVLDNGRMFIVEYKLNNPKILMGQVKRSDFAFGIINQEMKKKNFGFDYSDGQIIPYTGADIDCERIADKVLGSVRPWKMDNKRYYPFGSTRFDYSTLSVYWWGYMHEKSDINGGIKSGKRISFYRLYIRAIKNLQKHYDYKLDFDLTWSMLRFYGRGTALKHYKQAMGELELEREK